MMFGGWNGMMGGGFGGWSGFGILGGLNMFFMGIIPLLVIGLVVWAIVEATRRHDPVAVPVAQVPPASSGGAPTQTAAAGGASAGRALLYERYAKGEIGRDEYLQRRDDLT